MEDHNLSYCMITFIECEFLMEFKDSGIINDETRPSCKGTRHYP
jgi:hypothetical protein